jgi:hypothetical protein
MSFINSSKKMPYTNCEYKRIQKVAISCLFEAPELLSVLPGLLWNVSSESSDSSSTDVAREPADA